jgi:hypothetical protein
MKSALYIAAMLGVSVASLCAQSKPVPMSRAGLPQAKLAFLVGAFTTESRILPGPMVVKEAVGTGTSSGRWGLDSMFVFFEEQSVNPLLGSYKGFGVLGYDPGEKQYVLSMYNNFGDRPQYRGTFSGDTLILNTKVAARSGAFDQRILWFKQGDAIRLEVFNDKGSGFLPVIEETSRPISLK